mgnify:CR=1 FL=1
MKYLVSFSAVLLLAACGNPGDISDAEYAAYKELGSPKILYSCAIGDPQIVRLQASADCMGKGDLSDSCVEKAMSNWKPDVNVGYAAGIGVAVTYNKLLGDAKSACHGVFKILDSKS